ncbi:MAG TPA: MarC family protein [Stellaceae bacterium]|jgi:multiple antibiotic resistance protein|nr:MarC family protein [Stellaceae bacterium]
MSEGINAFLLAYAALFPIVNPIGGAPIFLALTRRLKPEVRRGLARRIAINGFCLLVGALFVGSHVLEFFGITLPVVRIGGGLVVTAFAWKLLNDNDAVEQKAHETGDRDEIDPAQEAFYPLTMPLTVGPGSLSVAITLGSQRPKVPPSFDTLLVLAAGAVAGILALAVTIYVCFRYADRLVAALGVSGTNVLTRLSAFILLCIGIQILWNGYSALITP